MKRILLIGFGLLLASQAQAFKAKPGFVKVELTSVSGVVSPIPVADLLAHFGGEDVADYSTFHIVYLPKGLLVAFEKSANAGGLRVRERDELDVINTPGASIDAREGIHGAGNLIHSYPAARRGLYLLQFAGPTKAEWSTAIENLGWTVVGYLPSNAYILAGKPSLVAATSNLSFVQFLDFYHPFERAALFGQDTDAHDVIVEVSPVDDRQPTIDAINKLSATSVRVQSYPNYVYVHARLGARDAAQLLSDPLVIGIGGEPVIELSDERVAMSLTTNVTSDGQPSNPKGYSSWLASHCSLCNATNMPFADWRVGIADSGLDAGSGSGSAHHPDLEGREYWGSDFVSSAHSSGNADATTHGTMLAGIIAGNRASGLADDFGITPPPANSGYYDGQGIAPFAGIFSTKIFDLPGSTVTGDIFSWASEATFNNVTIQNHSHNDYHKDNPDLSTAGFYTLESQAYDLATRDSDNDAARDSGHTTSDGQPHLNPILFTVSAGNIDQEPGTNRVIPPATAKNVIVMGASENSRQYWLFSNGAHCHVPAADGFGNIFWNSRRGTAVSGYFKPDLVAPATIVVSTKTRYLPDNHSFADCYDNFHPTDAFHTASDPENRYVAESGTSFAAPVAAGAAILVKRFLGSAPANTSPALVKAALIAGSRSIRDGVDHIDNTAVGPLPNMRQGFGRLTLERLFSQPIVTFDQDAARRFTTSGQTPWTTRLTVSDSSQPVTLALVWSDAAGTAGTSTATPLVNNLDLRIRPVVTPCQSFQGNSLDNGPSGETSHPFTCGAEILDSVNNVEYARFFPTGFTQFDVTVSASTIMGKADLSLPTNNQDFALVVMNATTVAPAPPVPPQLTAHRNASNPFAIDLTWTAPANFTVDHYTINRGSTLSNVTPTASTTNSTTFTFTDTSRPSAINTWVYSVTAWSSSSASTTSNVDYATTVQFTNAPVSNTTPILAQHITELRAAIDSIFVAGGHSAAAWTDPVLNQNQVTIKPAHINEMRTNLGTAVVPFSFSPTQYSFSIFVNQNIHKEDINELRGNIK
jgi:hypothetical protein